MSVVNDTRVLIDREIKHYLCDNDFRFVGHHTVVFDRFVNIRLEIIAQFAKIFRNRPKKGF